MGYSDGSGAALRFTPAAVDARVEIYAAVYVRRARWRRGGVERARRRC